MGWLVWAVVAVVVYAVWSVRARRVAGLPGPPWVPWFGNLLIMLKHKDDVYEAVLERMHNEKDNGFGVGCQSYAWAMPGGTAMINAHCSEANLRHILKTNFENYTMPASRVDAFRELFGRGIFAVHGKEWMVQRKAAASIFTMRLMRDSMFDVLSHHAAIFMKKLDALAATKAAADVQDLFFRFTMDSFAEIAFGEDLRCLESEHVHPFSRAFDLVQAGVMDRMMTTPLMWKPMRALGLGREGVIKQQLKVLNAQAYEFVRHRRADIDAGRDRNDLISHFLAAAKKAGEELTDEQMRDVMLNFLVAGRDTTACAMSWTVYELSRHPQVLAQVLAEIDRVVGLHRDGAKPTFDSVAELRYFEAVLMETLRLHPSVPVDSKQAINDDVLPDGTRIPAGADVTYNPFTFGRAKCIWGADAHDFKPERWLIDDSAAPKSPDAKADEDSGLNSGSTVTGGALTKVHNMYKYPIFNAGPRLCLGRGLALMEAKLLLATVLQRYTLEVLPDQHITYQVTITLMMRHGMRVTPKPRLFAA